MTLGMLVTSRVKRTKFEFFFRSNYEMGWPVRWANFGLDLLYVGVFLGQLELELGRL